jgi:DNA-binding XRE family transcriptional regulator
MYTHEDWKAYKKAHGLNNAKIAQMLGMTVDSVKTLTAKGKVLPKWTTLALFTFKNQTAQ